MHKFLITLLPVLLLAWFDLDAVAAVGSVCYPADIALQGSIHIRVLPDEDSASVAAISDSEQILLKLKTTEGFDHIEWFLVHHIGFKGWVKAANLTCRLSPDEARRQVADTARAVVSALRNRDMVGLSRHVDTDKGIRFSPYGYVDLSQDLAFSAEEVRELFEDKKNRIWGYYDGSGDKIELTFEDYYSRFVFDRDFSVAPQVGFNEVIGAGNTRNNSFEAYSDAVVVEYHYPGFEPDYGGMDWVSLKLVFEQHEGKWYLVGVVHDQWTI